MSPRRPWPTSARTPTPPRCTSHCTTHPEQTVLRVQDDGDGFATAVRSVGRGLAGLRERLALAGGTCVVSSAPGDGTTVTATLPTVTTAGPVLAEDATPSLPTVTRPVAEVTR